ncbi:hypothetical protein HOLleu_44242 [Holothuria leucospilota]|uniref:Uncharacterized protein n=1 Tax=Holothuria leucospilota TaxID=206669 RepID=A0A9Q1BAK0_HOLLE|nr:hypothetical protein HOLleu_44242 [Holothuria leucospilota]
MADEGTHDCQSDIEKMMSRPLDAPPTPSMEALGSHILKTKLQQSEDGMAVSFKTGGLVSTII